MTSEEMDIIACAIIGVGTLIGYHTKHFPIRKRHTTSFLNT